MVLFSYWCAAESKMKYKRFGHFVGKIQNPTHTKRGTSILISPPFKQRYILERMDRILMTE